MNAIYLLSVAFVPVAGPLDLDDDEVRAGLVAEHRSLVDAKAMVRQLEAKPAFRVEGTIHPRLPVGRFQSTWTGVLAIRDPGPFTFSAIVTGEIKVTVDGAVVVEGKAENARLVGNKSFALKQGRYPIVIEYRSPERGPARAQIFWESPAFAAEPIPAWRLGHVIATAPPAVAESLQVAEGRRTAEAIGCAQCHPSAFPGVRAPPPGPSLELSRERLSRDWVYDWLGDPRRIRHDARMPELFARDASGNAERWLIADMIGKANRPVEEKATGDHRMGRRHFMSIGCAACHLVPDVPLTEQEPLQRRELIGLADRYSSAQLASFLTNPHGRYPDGRMPTFPLNANQSRDIAAYLMLWSKPTLIGDMASWKLAPQGKPSTLAAVQPPAEADLAAALKRLDAADARAAGTKLLVQKGCIACHPGLGDAKAEDRPIRRADAGCLGDSGPRFRLSDAERSSLAVFVKSSADEVHRSPFFERQRLLMRAGCVQCHQRDSDRAPPIEQAGSRLGGAFLQELPYLKSPRLTEPHQRLHANHVQSTIQNGSSGSRGPRNSYQMPAFGKASDELALALAESDGVEPTMIDTPAKAPADPTYATQHGPRLVGFQGYGCASCHVWAGKPLGSPDPGATGPDLTRVIGRVKREWFDRFLEGPHRSFPGTPMPAIFQRGQPASIATVLDGDVARQKDAIWAYLALGPSAPAPTPPPPVPVAAPQPGEPVQVSQIPLRLPDNKVVESVAILSSHADLLIYDLAEAGPHSVFVGGQIRRNVQGRSRQLLAHGERIDLADGPGLRVLHPGKVDMLVDRQLLAIDRLADGVRIQWELRVGKERIALDDTIRLPHGRERSAKREVRATGLPGEVSLELRTKRGEPIRLTRANPAGSAAIALPPARPAPTWDLPPIAITDLTGGSLVRPGYRAFAYPRPKTIAGEDRVMPGAVAVRPRDGQVFVASLKTAELFALRDPKRDGTNATFEPYAHGLFQDALSMLAEDDGLYVLHRRNLTKVIDTNNDGFAERLERVAALPHGVADTYDYAYGLARDGKGRFVFGYAPYSNATMPGSGGALRLTPGKPPEEVAYGMRNPLGWSAGPNGDVFYTDNQGEWVAANKLAPVVEGQFFGFPNRSQPQHASKPRGKTAIWVPYSWGRSINGVTYDQTNGKFGPFAGQFFMAELMFGGAIVRADVEKVNGIYQGACFPFWGEGLMGPVTLAFDPRGRLYVGGITEPGWMAQPDRGALYAIDYTGELPFEMKTIRVTPNGFRVVFTRPVSADSASKLSSWKVESYRYEYTGSYGSPELDRTAVKVEQVKLAADGLSAELITAPLVVDRVYMISAGGVRSGSGEALVHPSGAYTLNEVPVEKR